MKAYEDFPDVTKNKNVKMYSLFFINYLSKKSLQIRI